MRRFWAATEGIRYIAVVAIVGAAAMIALAVGVRP